MIGERPINELAAALAKAQAKITNAEKSAENPAFKRDGKAMRYATLADVWNACRGPLTENGLSIVQCPRRTENGVEVETTLLHTSGQWISTALEVPAGNTAQAFGSAITYARRYTLAAIVGIAPDEDDDGTAASEHVERRPARREPPREERRARDNERDETIESKNDGLADNDKELRDLCQSLATKLRKHTGKSIAQMRESAKVPASGSLSSPQLALFVRYCKTELTNYEDPNPDDLPCWADGSQRDLDDEIDNPGQRVGGRSST